jgi:hypothetical protein
MDQGSAGGDSVVRRVIMVPQKRQVYMLRFPNGMVYIGTTYDVFQRWASSGAHYKGMLVGDAIEEFGWENVKKDIVFQLPEGEESTYFCECIEKQLIERYQHKSYNERGTKRYNRRMSEIRKKSDRVYEKIAIPFNGGTKTRDELIEEYGPGRFTQAYEWIQKYDITIEQAFTLPRAPKGMRSIDYWNSIGIPVRRLTEEETLAVRRGRGEHGSVWKKVAETRGSTII